MKRDTAMSGFGLKAVALSHPAFYRRQIRGQERECVSRYFPDHRLYAGCICIILVALLIAGTVRAESLLPEMFLPAEAGKVVILADSSGMKRSFFCIKRDKNKALIEEVICCFQPASKEDPPVEINMPGYKLLPTPKEPWSTKEQYTLSVDGSRLVSGAYFGGITLLDLAGGSWTVPIFSSPGMPKTETCRAVSWQSKPYFGKERTLVTVECNACLDGEIVHTETWTLATGIGFVGMTDFKLSSIETIP